MTKSLTAVLAAAGIAALTMGGPAPAHARDGAIAAGIIGGLAAGAIIGGALAGPPAYAGPVYVAPPPPPPPAAYYYGPPPPYAASCYWAAGEPVWNGYRWVHSRVRVCE